MFSYLKLLFKRTQKSPIACFEQYNHAIVISPKKVKAFRQLFALNKSQKLPPSYAFIAAFPYLIKMFADKRFAYSPLGLIHLSSEFIEHQAINYSAPISIKIELKQNINDQRGKLIHIETSIYQNEILSLINNNIMLKKIKTKAATRSVKSQQKYNFTGELLEVIKQAKIINYCKASGDFNPIHINTFMAKLFGFPKPIAHGMYLLNAAIAKTNIEPSYVKAQFKKPCFINTTAEININRGKINVFSERDKLHLDIAFRD
ncbi:MaoC/PaaZ C-terminal domain-containing protein [Thalassomonas sp. M1454]|uniref:MaoC/PaaZ C-terminal domain-containing protein n=1 Tax=Thalassomonas sp. M1454 TaxID=2594477 RepID=UPI00117F78E6|nr:MaoC/PaaZ C-terminal domain-containing protein [Thalassomonas sp. M1454]TRX55772.1 hypothetical protein FNN08_09100 [Thalassomonas sp. M1454]